MTARSWLDMVNSHSAGAGVFWQSGENASKRLVARSSHLGKDARVGWFFGRNGFAGGDGPKGGVGQQPADQLRVQGVTRSEERRVGKECRCRGGRQRRKENSNERDG